MEHARERNELETSFAAVYGKLGRLPIPVSMGFLSGCTARLMEVFPQSEMACVAVPDSLATFRPIVFDGKAIKNVAKRLLPLRGAPARLLPRRTFVPLAARACLP